MGLCYFGLKVKENKVFFYFLPKHTVNRLQQVMQIHIQKVESYFNNCSSKNQREKSRPSTTINARAFSWLTAKKN